MLAYVRQTKEKRFRCYIQQPSGAVFHDGDYATRKEANQRIKKLYPDVTIITKRDFFYRVYHTR